MSNKFGITENELERIRERDKKCAYCHKLMIYPFVSKNQKDSATIEHLNFDGPFYIKDGLELKDIVICCGECNSSRGEKKLSEWFKTKYCIHKKINENTVSESVKNYLIRNKNK